MRARRHVTQNSRPIMWVHGFALALNEKTHDFRNNANRFHHLLDYSSKSDVSCISRPNVTAHHDLIHGWQCCVLITLSFPSVASELKGYFSVLVAHCKIPVPKNVN